jgi:hypothetical protein
MHDATKIPAGQTQQSEQSERSEHGASRSPQGNLQRPKPKLLQLCAVDFTVFHFLVPLATALQDDYDVHFASSGGEYVGAVRDRGFVYHTIPIERSYNLFAHFRAFLALRKLIKKERYQIVHAHTPIASLIGRAAARSAGVRVSVYTAHGFYFHDRMRPAVRRFFVFLEKMGGRLTDHCRTEKNSAYRQRRRPRAFRHGPPGRRSRIRAPRPRHPTAGAGRLRDRPAGP